MEPFKYRNYYDSYWKPLIENLNLGYYTPHCTRHTCISLLAEARVDQTSIKKIVGHAGAMTLTERVYTHLDIGVLFFKQLFVFRCMFHLNTKSCLKNRTHKATTVLQHRIGENLLHVLLQLAANSLQQGTKKSVIEFTQSRLLTQFSFLT